MQNNNEHTFQQSDPDKFKVGEFTIDTEGQEAHAEARRIIASYANIQAKDARLSLGDAITSYGEMKQQLQAIGMDSTELLTSEGEAEYTVPIVLNSLENFKSNGREEEAKGIIKYYLRTGTGESLDEVLKETMRSIPRVKLHSDGKDLRSALISGFYDEVSPSEHAKRHGG